ncbi:hypothetical protein GX50_07658 [[Emmonsia] crescens]|uniref:Uncharacterized protein n=1 Tax=[Emmonsia] crescens TaxID=73230 RepID=A0A2B7Z823_9EURO|nr:hypothetical protein GX50_07658 [Emmonsia crescens]
MPTTLALTDWSYFPIRIDCSNIHVLVPLSKPHLLAVAIPNPKISTHPSHLNPSILLARTGYGGNRTAEKSIIEATTASCRREDGRSALQEAPEFKKGDGIAFMIMFRLNKFSAHFSFSPLHPPERWFLFARLLALAFIGATAAVPAESQEPRKSDAAKSPPAT